MKILYLIIFYVICLPQTAFSQENPDIPIGKKYRMTSPILKEDRLYWVHLPNSYNDKIFSPKKYPVLVLLDGDAHFHWATGVVKFLSSNRQIPEMIVVAIPNSDRNRDLSPCYAAKGYDGKETDLYKTSGGGDNFLRFLNDELLPKIDSTYRTIPYKILVGHSLGGTLATHSFLKEEKTFDSYISIDPAIWFNERWLVKKVKDAPSKKRHFDSSLYTSIAHNSESVIDSTEGRKAIEEFQTALKEHSDSTLNSKLQYFEEEDHGTVPLVSLYNGLLFTFAGFHLTNPHEKDIASISSHYQNIPTKFKVNSIPPEDMINDIGYHHLFFTKDYKKAMEFFAWNIQLYPESYNVYDSQAEAYAMTGEKKKAIQYYKKSLDINPNNKHATHQIHLLKDK